MAEMKHLLMLSLSAMESEIQTIKTDVNKSKKRKVFESAAREPYAEKGRLARAAVHMYLRKTIDSII